MPGNVPYQQSQRQAEVAQRGWGNPMPGAGGEMPAVAAQGGMDPNMMQQFSAMFAQLPKDQQDKLLADLTRDYEGEGLAIGREEELADALRTPMPGMRQAGGLTIAANPMEFLGKGIGDARSANQSEELLRRRAELSAGRGRGRQGPMRGQLGRADVLRNPQGFPDRGANNAF